MCISAHPSGETWTLFHAIHVNERPTSASMTVTQWSFSEISIPTTIRMAPAMILEEPTRGPFRVGRQQISFGWQRKGPAAGKLAAYRSRIGMVFQHFELFPHMTALQTSSEGPVTVKRMDRPARQSWRAASSRKVGLAGKEESYPAALGRAAGNGAPIAAHSPCRPK